jgi:hypothetical protein
MGIMILNGENNLYPLYHHIYPLKREKYGKKKYNGKSKNESAERKKGSISIELS